MQVPLAIQSVTTILTATASTSNQPLMSIANTSKLNAVPLVTTPKPPTAETDTEVTVNTLESIPSDKSKQNTVAKDVALTNANGKIIDTNGLEIGTVVISTLADKWMDNGSAQVPKSKVTNEPELTDSSNNSVPLTCTSLNGLPGNTNNNNAEPVTEPTIKPLTSTDLVRKVEIKPPPVTPHHDIQMPTLVSLDEISNDSLLNLDITKSDVVTSHSGIITKECHVVLEPISIDDFKNKQTSATLDTKENVTKDDDSGFSENNQVLPDLVADDHLANDSDTPLSVLREQNKARKHRQRRQVEYTESSLNSTSDSDFKQTTKKQWETQSTWIWSIMTSYASSTRCIQQT